MDTRKRNVAVPDPTGPQVTWSMLPQWQRRIMGEMRCRGYGTLRVVRTAGEYAFCDEVPVEVEEHLGKPPWVAPGPPVGENCKVNTAYLEFFNRIGEHPDGTIIAVTIAAGLPVKWKATTIPLTMC